MDIKQALFAFLKKKRKTWDDVEFIIAIGDSDDEDIWKKQFEITKEDFVELATSIDVSDMGFMKFVGKDFYVTSETENGYFEFITIPQRPERKRVLGGPAGVAKAALLGEEDPATRLGIRFNG